MKQVTVRLIDGKEYNFKIKSEDDDIVHSKSLGTLTYVSDNGTIYSFVFDQISVQIFRECIKCPHCGNEIMPIEAKMFASGEEVQIIKSCPHCGEEINAT